MKRIDKIRSMSALGLARYLRDIGGLYNCPPNRPNDCRNMETCNTCWAAWLEQEEGEAEK